MSWPNEISHFGLTTCSPVWPWWDSCGHRLYLAFVKSETVLMRRRVGANEGWWTCDGDMTSLLSYVLPPDCREGSLFRSPRAEVDLPRFIELVKSRLPQHPPPEIGSSYQWRAWGIRCESAFRLLLAASTADIEAELAVLVLRDSE